MHFPAIITYLYICINIMYIGGHYVGILVFLSFFSSCCNAITCVHLVLPQFRDCSSLLMPWKIYRLNKPISVCPHNIHKSYFFITQLLRHSTIIIITTIFSSRSPITAPPLDLEHSHYKLWRIPLTNHNKMTW